MTYIMCRRVKCAGRYIHKDNTKWKAGRKRSQGVRQKTPFVAASISGGMELNMTALMTTVPTLSTEIATDVKRDMK